MQVNHRPACILAVLPLQELTKDPHLYLGKDGLPDVRVALRVTGNRSKRLKVGDNVCYVICEVSSEEGSGAHGAL